MGILARKSIRFRIMSIYVLIIITMFIGLIASVSNQNKIIREYDHFARNNTNLSALPVKINQSAQNFEQYLRGRDPNVLVEYYLVNKEIEGILESIRYDIINDRNSSMYFRALRNMQAYQQEAAEEIFCSEVLDIKVYIQFSYLRNLYTYMNREAQMLTFSYLDYSTAEYAKLLYSSKDIEKNMYMIVTVFGLISIGFAVALSKGIFRTMDEICVTATQLSSAQWEIPDIKTNPFSELNMVADAFNNMKKNIKRYIEELNAKAEVEIQLSHEKLMNVEKDKLLQESQLLALQMQMNPHFLFNTLNMIGRTAMLEDTDNTVLLIESISEILRYNLESKGKMVPIEKEISALRAYTFIQQMRFQERMHFEFKCTADLQGVCIPPMILQPIVENSIIHGLEDKKRGGKVFITIERERSYLKIIMGDNGKGIEENKLKGILSSAMDAAETGQKTSMGISNVKKRLALNYKRENLIAIQSQPGIGTTVTIYLPMKEAMGND
ncbi:sensor histidine kinase [Geosporobacter ferrireducens]|uniref:Histidine kinase domain-containing protein n=1 Tax=Geosporobacter ferrireducens TaxID=1424294 RepID=A0A1D8GK25_9FIRM|nr:histidine kinase [Geosporobacter ferrireducens]AOT71260.1 hypothetical protein Gferi_17890 [Geosporobacter ferrireducens]